MKSRLMNQIANPEFWKSLNTEKKLQESFSNEVSITVKEISYCLPTARETEALPFLELLGDQLIDLLDQERYLAFFDEICKNENLIEIFFEDLFQGTVDAVYKGKLYHEKKIVQTADIIFLKLVELSTNLLKLHPKGENFYVLNLVGRILDRRMEYYRNTGREAIQSYPFGELLRPDKNKKVWVEESIQEGMPIDCVRVTNGKKMWGRGIYLGGANSSFCRVRYQPDGSDGYLTNKHQELAPYKSRSIDWNWRTQIKVGDYLDVFTLTKKWMLARVLKVKKKKEFIYYAREKGKTSALFGKNNYHSNLDKNDSSDEDKYDYFNNEEDSEVPNKKEQKYEDSEEGFWGIN